MSTIPIPALRLHTFTQQVFTKLGYGAEDADRAADVLHHADLRGHDTHGVANLVPLYVGGTARGEIAVNARSRWVRQRGACALLDAGGGLGLLAGQQAMGAAIELARDAGIGCVVVRNSTHFGAAGFYAQLAREQGLIGLALTNLGKQPVAHALGSRDALLGTNPIAFAAPAGQALPMLLDISTTVVASGKIRQALRRGEPVPEGWLFDAQGQAVDDPARYGSGEARLPMLGGLRRDTGGHKGMGLALMVEVLCGALSGAHTAGQREQPGGNSVGHFMLAIEPAFFGQPAIFDQAMDALLGCIGQAATLPGEPALRYPGQPGVQTMQQRQRDGVPLDRPLLDQLRQLAADLNLTPLETLHP
jgi:LDH2 family malate/lactate/ureidoglycolate dehydrogenase